LQKKKAIQMAVLQNNPMTTLKGVAANTCLVTAYGRGFSRITQNSKSPSMPYGPSDAILMS